MAHNQTLPKTRKTPIQLKSFSFIVEDVRMQTISQIWQEANHVKRAELEFLKAMYRKLWWNNRRLRYVAFSPADIFRASRTEIILWDRWADVAIFKSGGT